jgi:hypothetical protein
LPIADFGIDDWGLTIAARRGASSHPVTPQSPLVNTKIANRQYTVGNNRLANTDIA